MTHTYLCVAAETAEQLRVLLVPCQDCVHELVIPFTRLFLCLICLQNLDLLEPRLQLCLLGKNPLPEITSMQELFGLVLKDVLDMEFEVASGGKGMV